MKIAITENLPDPIKNVLENIVSTVTRCWDVEHSEDGKHKAVTCAGDVVAQGLGSFAGQTRCRLRKRVLGNQSLTSGVETPILWDSPISSTAYFDYDTDRIFNQDGTSYNILPKVKGIYLVTAGLRYAANAVGQRFVGVEWGLDNMGWGPIMQDPGGLGCSSQTTCIIDFDPNSDDSNKRKPFRVLGLQTSGGALDVLSASNGTTFVQVTKIG